MKHFQTVDAEDYAGYQNPSDLKLLKLKKNKEVSVGDELIVENKADASAPQLSLKVLAVKEHPALRNGWRLVDLANAE
jgi:hypothetical protein